VGRHGTSVQHSNVSKKQSDNLAFAAQEALGIARIPSHDKLSKKKKTEQDNQLFGNCCNMGATTLWSRDVVANRILAGETLIIYQGHLLSIPPAWMNAHPGGNLALLHFVGKDATDEIEASHLDDTLKLVSRYSVGRVELTEDGWEPLVPPVQTGWVRRLGQTGKQEWFKEATELVSNDGSESFPSSSILLVERDNHSQQLTTPTLASLQPLPSNLSLKVQTRHSRAYRELHKRITDAGLYKTRYISGYGPEIARCTLLGCISAYAYLCNWIITSAVFLGLFWHHLVFSAHDLGHMGVTHNWAIDRILATLIADFMGGLSIGWWVQVRIFNFTIYKVWLTQSMAEPYCSPS